LELSDDWRKIARTADAVCFGSLAQRNNISRKTICEFIGLTENWRIFDVNLRQKFFSSQILRKSLNLANVVKFNHEELPFIAEMFEVKENNPIAAAQRLLFQFDLKLICVTRGANGSLLISKDEVSENAGLKIQVKDTIGAGDAFTAALAHGILRRWTLNEINEFANKVGAFVASNRGAMPNFPEEF
jgi:fructokinase